MDYGHLTYIPVESVYYGWVFLHVIQLLVFLVDINKMETWVTYIGNSHLEAKTLNKFDIIAGT